MTLSELPPAASQHKQLQGSPSRLPTGPTLATGAGTTGQLLICYHHLQAVPSAWLGNIPRALQETPALPLQTMIILLVCSPPISYSPHNLPSFPPLTLCGCPSLHCIRKLGTPKGSTHLLTSVLFLRSFPLVTEDSTARPPQTDSGCRPFACLQESLLCSHFLLHLQNPHLFLLDNITLFSSSLCYHPIKTKNQTRPP